LRVDDRRYECAADPARPVAGIAMQSCAFYSGTSILPPLAASQLCGFCFDTRMTPRHNSSQP
jgi:hypothetical protein